MLVIGILTEALDFLVALDNSKLFYATILQRFCDALYRVVEQKLATVGVIKNNKIN